MSIKDIINDSLKQGEEVVTLSSSSIIVTVCVALICSLIIYCVYKFFYRGAVYSESFNILNVMLCLITSFVITTIGSNIVLSLGMVGALSIVRFRSAIKDPLDIGFLFWSIASGITTGAGLYPFAIVSTLIIAVVYILFTVITTGKKTFLLVLKYSDNADDAVREALANIPNTLKSRNIFKGMNELTVQIKVKKGNTDFMNKLTSIDGVESAMLVEYTGDSV